MISQRMMVGAGGKYETWSFTVNTEAVASGEKTTGIPFNLYGQDGVTLDVDWGDGTVSTLSAADYAENNSTASLHEYETAGIYTITIGSKNWKRACILVIANTTNISTINNAVASLY